MNKSLTVGLGALASFSLSLFACLGDDSNPITSSGKDGGAGEGSVPGVVNVQLLAFNDFHGNLEEPTGGNARVVAMPGDPLAGDGGVDAGVIVDGGAPVQYVTAGGAAYFAAHVKQLRAQNPNTLLVSSGDLTGASPLSSSLFHDEPTVLAFNAMGLDYNGVGNHEFDHGVAELLRLQVGGCNPVDQCNGQSFAGASFQYLAANVETAPGRTIFPRYEIKQVGGAKIAFIGMTLQGTPQVESAASVAGLTFDPEIDTVNALLPQLKGQVDAVVVLLHQGGFQVAGSTYNDCNMLTGDIQPILSKLDPAVDVIHTAHTHQPYNCTMMGGLLVTSAASFGRIITQINLTIDTVAHKVTAKTAQNIPVTRDLPKDTDVDSIVQKYVTLAAPLANRVVGHITADVSNMGMPSGESPLGDVIADAMLDATSAANAGNAQIAFMNPGGIRASLVYAQVAMEGDGVVTYAKAYTVQPFANNLVTFTLTGDQIHQVLEQQFMQMPPKVLQPSKGFTYTWDSTKPVGMRVDPTTIQLGGVTIDPATSYRVTVNSFLATGGDGFALFKSATMPLTGSVDIDAFVAYLGAHDPLTPPPATRITTK